LLLVVLGCAVIRPFSWPEAVAAVPAAAVVIAARTRRPGCAITRSCRYWRGSGLRGAEAADLRLDDIDWRAGEIAVTGEGSRTERLRCRPRPGRRWPHG
jgi:integrase